MLDKDDSVTGYIEEITLFSVQLRDDQGNLATYPNNLFLQRPVVKIEAESQEKPTSEFED